ncbi:MAG TPA: GNAT family N-acetyltransferase [Pyrinomonadaceae bacterium]|nr:GNAT family N-acetyltransferase [Pyrinomonadaceae bacterium]
MRAPPIIETARLVLRPPRLNDAEAIFNSYATDEEVTRYLVWRPHTSIAETEEFLSRVVAFLEDGSRLTWALTLHGDDTPRGMIELRPHGHKADVGYVLARPFWGRGYMTEALCAVLDYAFRNHDTYRVWAVCDAENVASARVMEKAGMSFEGILQRYQIRPQISPAPRDARSYARVRQTSDAKEKPC